MHCTMLSFLVQLPCAVNENGNSLLVRRWDKFEESYRMMHFSNGDKCWNGPDRSLKVLAIIQCCILVMHSSFRLQVLKYKCVAELLCR